MRPLQKILGILSAASLAPVAQGPCALVGPAILQLCQTSTFQPKHYVTCQSFLAIQTAGNVPPKCMSNMLNSMMHWRKACPRSLRGLWPNWLWPTWQQQAIPTHLHQHLQLWHLCNQQTSRYTMTGGGRGPRVCKASQYVSAG